MIELWEQIPVAYQLVFLFCACCWVVSIVFLVKAEKILKGLR